MVVLRGVAVSCERGTPVRIRIGFRWLRFGFWVESSIFPRIVFSPKVELYPSVF